MYITLPTMSWVLSALYHDTGNWTTCTYISTSPYSSYVRDQSEDHCPASGMYLIFGLMAHCGQLVGGALVPCGRSMVARWFLTLSGRGSKGGSVGSHSGYLRWTSGVLQGSSTVWIFGELSTVWRDWMLSGGKTGWNAAAGVVGRASADIWSKRCYDLSFTGCRRLWSCDFSAYLCEQMEEASIA